MQENQEETPPLIIQTPVFFQRTPINSSSGNSHKRKKSDYNDELSESILKAVSEPDKSTSHSQLVAETELKLQNGGHRREHFDFKKEVQAVVDNYEFFLLDK